MVQVKIYGLKEYLNPIKTSLSDAVHSCIIDALQYPADKRAHRFFRWINLIFFILLDALSATPLWSSA
jgi:hypothetical protein